MSMQAELELFDVHDDDGLEARRLERSEAILAAVERLQTAQARRAAKRLRAAIASMREAMAPAKVARVRRRWEETAALWRS